MESETQGRDGTCPAGNGTVAGRIARAGACVIDNGARAGQRGRETVKKILEQIPRVHAGKFLLTGVRPGLPVRLVKKIDRLALRILRAGRGRFCL